MKVSVKYLAGIREAIGMPAEGRDTQTATLAALRDEPIALGGAYAESLARGKAVRLALNQVGLLQPLDQIVMVAVTAAHRGEIQSA